MENFDINRLDAYTLKVFLKMIETGSVTKSAEHFGINQSTASHALDKLRAAIGDVLFVRTGRGLSPTSTAITLVPLAQQVVLSVEALQFVDAYNPNDDKRPITIAANVAELCPELTDLSKRLTYAFPLARVRLIELGGRESLETILSNEIADLAITVFFRDFPLILSRQNVISDRLRVFFDGRVRKPIKTLEEYFSSEHVSLDFGGNSTSTVSQIISSLGGSRRMKVGVANVYALASIIRGSDYVATMQERLVNSAFSDLSHVQPPFEAGNVKFDMVWHKRREHDPRTVLIRELTSMTFKKFNKNIQTSNK